MLSASLDTHSLMDEVESRFVSCIVWQFYSQDVSMMWNES